MAHHLELRALKKKDFKIRAIPVHHLFGWLSRKFGYYTNPLSVHFPLSIRYSIYHTSKFFKELSGIDLYRTATFLVENHLSIVDDKEIIGRYGAHSKTSKKITAKFEKDGKVLRLCAKGDELRAENLWLCGHYTGKSFTALYKDFMNLRKNKDERANKKILLLWQTKSIVQPRSTVDEWKVM